MQCEKRRLTKHDVIREGFLWDLCLHWRDGLELPLKTSSNAKGATGPLVRYLTAASAPAFKKLKEKQPSPNALRHFVREHGEWA